MTKLGFLKSLFLLVFSATFTSAVLAQDITYKFENEILVEADSQSSLISDAAVKTEVISAKEIQANHYKDAADVVDNLPGVNISQNERRSGQSAVIQGLDEDRVLVLIDGVRQEQTSSYGFDLSQIPADHIERIEVVKGAASALYGSQAMGGAINIITKKTTNKTSYSLDMKSGQYAEGLSAKTSKPVIDLSAGLSGKLKSFGYRTQIGLREESPVDRDNTSFSNDMGESTKLNGSLYFDKQSKLSRVFTQYRVFKEDLKTLTGLPLPTPGSEETQNITDMLSQSLTIGFDREFSNQLKLQSHVSYELIKDELSLQDKIATAYQEQFETSNYRTARAELSLSQLFFNRHLLTGGFSISQSELDRESQSASSTGVITANKDVNNKSYSSIEAFAQDDIIFDKLELVPGFRIQRDADFGAQLSPKLSAKYKFTDQGERQWSAHTSVGTGYRVPNLKERFYLLDHSSLGYVVAGNENLQPETSVSYQLGTEYRHTKSESYYLNLFYNDMTDLINTQSSPQGSLERLEYVNLSRVSIIGTELQWRLQPIRLFESEVSYTYTKATNKDTGKAVAFRPESVALLKLNFLPQNKFNFSTAYKYKSEQFTDEDNTASTPSFGVLDFRLNYQAQSSTSFYLGIENALSETRPASMDTTNPVADQRPAVGAFYYLGFQFKG